MIFASDLDRTLIYSKQAMGTDIKEADIVPVELYEGRHISFMSKTAAKLLHDLSASAYFIPVTTRTVEQYSRIFYIKDTLRPQIAITSNGGTILRNGQPDEEWAVHVHKALQSSADANEVMQLFDRIASPDWVLSIKHAEQLFYSIVVVLSCLPLNEMEQLRVELSTLGWNLSIQGRKIYLVPAGLSKGSALRYVMDRLGSTADNVVAAGDSLLDQSLLDEAHLKLAPSHGELYNQAKANADIIFTDQSGILASAEMITKAKQWFALQAGQTDTSHFAYNEVYNT
ncbi:HAD family hydrolase [Paenibacillus pini]|uniref:Sucrose phosphatase-like domain-containing protein n=1 Tax=Paenibacillus pini JCM 16418 TaxID=1236976 RepID=W7YPF3_9BACL|nr:HAD family hydrolase [Paenibacillus pini]GAF09513.1 hypothetical protein JCM16418_3656 [Paenibacillus pini JCM 16418]